jgi:hypothetical protein
MEPLLCITAGPNIRLHHQCFMWYIGPFSSFPTLLYPVLNHYGYDSNTSSYRQMCKCPMTEEMSYCNTIDMVSQFLFYNNASSKADPYTLAAPLFDLVLQYNSTQLTEETFYAHSTGNFSFCYSSRQSGYCSMVAFSNYGPFEHQLSQYFHQLSYGACNNSFTSNQFSDLITNPPVSLYESYFECVPTG